MRFMSKKTKKITKFFLYAFTLVYVLSHFSSITIPEVLASSEKTYSYTGTEEVFTASKTGEYQIEVWGASGGGSSLSNGGMGGYTRATIKMLAGDKLYVHVGQKGEVGGGSTYGGGAAANNANAGAGGGASWVTKNSIGSQNHVNADANLLLASGGGGGRWSTNQTTHSFRGGYSIGSGAENPVDYHPHSWAPDGVFGHQGAQSVTSGTIASSSTVGGGAGGGGYVAGGGGNDAFYGGLGGKSFINTIQDLTNCRYVDAIRLGDGQVKITYVGNFDVNISLVLNNNGIFDNGDYYSDYKQTFTFSYPAGSSVDFPDVTTKDNIVFTGYKFLGEHENSTLKNNILTLGLYDVTLEAMYKSTGISFSGYQVSENTVHLDWNELGAEYYIVSRGADSDGTDVTKGYDTLNLEDVQAITSTPVTLVNSTTAEGNSWIVPSTGYWQITAYGQKGNGTATSGHYGAHNGYADGVGGAQAIVSLYLKEGQKITYDTSSYRGGNGAGGGEYHGTYLQSGAGGNGIGVKVDDTLVLVAGGGAGATTAMATYDGCHWSAYSGGGFHSGFINKTNPTTYGVNAWPVYWRCGERDGCVTIPGGGGGGRPGGGVDAGDGSQRGHSGHCWRIGTFNGKDSENYAAYAGSNNTKNFKVIAQLVKIGGGTRKTSGNYELVDKKGPFTPTPTADGGFHVEGNEQSYTISWNPTEDRASRNNFVVSSFNASGGRLHTSHQISFDYMSGFSHYIYSVDHNKTTQLKTGKMTTETNVKVPFSDETKYVHIAAVDKAGNVSDTLTIILSGNKTIYYSGNGILDCESWSDGKGTYKYTTDVEGVSPDSVMLQDGESHTVVQDYGWKKGQTTSGYYREGYHHTLTDDEAQKFVWNTSPDGTGKTYYTGDVIDYDDVDGSITLYAMWTANTYTISFDENTGTMQKPGVYLYNPSYTDTNTIEITFNKTDFNYLYGDIPTKTGYSFMGWYDKQQNNVIGSGNQSITGKAAGKQAYKGNGHATQGSKYWNEDNQWIYAGDVTLYANWKSNVYKITLDKDKATDNGTSEIYLRYDDGYYTDSKCSKKITKINVPTREGWNFFGYYTKTQDSKQEDKKYGTGDSWEIRDGYWETFKKGSSPLWIDADGNIKSSNVAVRKNTTLYAYMRDNIKPTVAIKYKTSDGNVYVPGTWTPYTVTATVTASDSGTGMRGYKWIKELDEGNTWISDTTWTPYNTKKWEKTTRSYGTVSVMDNAYEDGYYSEDNLTTIDVGTITDMILVDKTKPYFATTPVYKNTIPQEHDYNTGDTTTCVAVITMDGADDHSGVDKYIVTGTANVPSKTDKKWQKSNIWKIERTGWYYCWSIDKVGNISKGFKIYIDLTCPTIEDVYTKTTHTYIQTYTDKYEEEFTVKREQLDSDKIFYYPWVNGNFRLHFTSKDEEEGVGVEKIVVWKGEKGTTQVASSTTGDVDYIVNASENEGSQLWTIQSWDKKGNTSYIKVVTRIDITSPKFMGSMKIQQPDIRDVKASQIESVIANADNFKTVFEMSVSDYKGTAIEKDTSGVRDAYLNVMDTTNTAIHNSYKYNNVTIEKKLTANEWERHLIESDYQGRFNTFIDFPDSNLLCTYAILVDNAGNISINGKPMKPYKYIVSGSTDPNGFETTGPEAQNDPNNRVEDDPNDTDDDIDNPYDNDSDGGFNLEEGRPADIIPNIPDGDGIPDYIVQNNPVEIGDVVLQNFSIMTYIENDESSQYNVNVDTGNIYFRLNEKGHVTVYTIGYVQKIQLDFMSMGEESAREIRSGLLNPQYNMGTPEGTYARYLDYTKGVELVSTSLETGESIARNSDGIPFATKYELGSLWGSNGTAVLMPPYYEMQDDMTKPQNEDGTYPKKWEKRYFKSIAHKTNKKTNVTQTLFDKNSYILWSDYALDIHYRVTHES